MRRRLLCFTLLVALGGCAGMRPRAAAADPDANSGADGKRSGARALGVNTAVTDEVSAARGDRSDWYKIALKGQPGVLAAELHWDSPSADLMVDVFDRFGAQLSASPARGQGEQAKKLLTPIDRPGVYYVRVTAAGRTDGSVYTLEARWDSPAEPRVTVRAPRSDGPTLQGRIVQAYREGDEMALQIDKGADQGVRVGMGGTVLSGPSGEESLDGGAFRVIAVLGGSKCLAKASVRSLGRNNRVMITLGR